MRIHLCLLGKKGFFFLLGVISSENLIDVKLTIEVGRDKGVSDDYAEQILDLAKKNFILSTERLIDFDYSNYDFVFAAGWRWMIGGIRDNQLIVLHDSLLPKYRGFAPLFNALLKREPYVGVTALFGSSEYDKGNIITQSKIKITYPIKISAAIDLISSLYEDIALNLLNYTKKGQLPSLPQNESVASYSCWLDDRDYYINWRDSAEDIVHKICLLGAPYSHAKTFLNGSLVYLIDAELIKGIDLERTDFGKVIMIEDGCPIVIASDGLVKLNVICNEELLNVLPIKKFRSRFGNDSI